MSEDVPGHEIVIVKRRRGGDDHGGHSSAWKIAYADFMTAMMALFLVLWLVNSSSEATKKQLANYFNPLNLRDQVPKPKGLEEDVPDEVPDKTDKDEGDKSAPPAFKSDTNPASLPEEPSKGTLIINGRPPADQERGTGKLGMPTRTFEPGKAFRDPFDPDFRSELVEQEAAITKDQKPSRDEASKGGAASPAAVAAARKQADQVKQIEQQASAISKDIAAALKDWPRFDLPGVEIVTKSEGVLISITDNERFGMFTSASAAPNPDAVKLLSAIAGVLGKRSGQIIVRGHTDGRPFRSADNDNWKLSLARAYAAFAAMSAAGVSETRIERIEGFAERQLKVASDPGAPANRRIEILLVADGA